jgi:hypothetical protein
MLLDIYQPTFYRRIHLFTVRCFLLLRPVIKRITTMILNVFIIASLFQLLWVSSVRAELRQFADANGRQLRGELVSLAGDSVTIKREDGSMFTLKAAAFSAADQAYFKQAAAALPAGTVAQKPPAPKITPKDVRDFPFCATMKSVKLNPKLKDMFDELQVTTSDGIRIHGKKKEDSGKVVYHNGKLAPTEDVWLNESLASSLIRKGAFYRRHLSRVSAWTLMKDISPV